MARNKNNFAGIASMASYPIVEAEKEKKDDNHKKEDHHKKSGQMKNRTVSPSTHCTHTPGQGRRRSGRHGSVFTAYCIP